MTTIFEKIQASGIAVAISEGASAFPWLETVHVLAATTVVGTILIVDLRLIGYPAHRRSARRLIVELLPFTWGAFMIALVTGSLLFASNATSYAANSVFQAKMLVLLAAAVNMGIFHMTAHRRIVEWDDMLPPPRAARLAGGLSLLCWIMVVFLGRWIGFTLF